MRHAEVSYVDDAGRPVRPGAGAADADAAASRRSRRREALAGVELDLVVASDLPRTVETAELVAPGHEVERWPELAEWRGGRLDAIPPEELERAFVGALRVKDEAAALPRRRVARRGARPRPSRAGAARRARVGHRARRPPRRRQPDRHLLRPLRRPHLLRRLRAGAGVPQRPRPRRRRLDRPHRQLHPLRPAPPGARDDDGAPLGAVAAVPRRARVAPPPPPGAGRRRGSPSTSASAPRRARPRRTRRAARSVTSRRSPVRQRVPEEGRHVVLRLAEHRLRVDRDRPARRAKDVVVVEVAVHERVPTDLERRVELARQRGELEPARPRRATSAPGRRSSGTAPPPAARAEPGRDGDPGRLLVGQVGDVRHPRARSAARAALGRAEAGAQPRRRPTARARRPPRRTRRPPAASPSARRRRRPARRRSSSESANGSPSSSPQSAATSRATARERLAQRSRSTSIAIPWPPPTHIVSSPIVRSIASRSLRSVHMIRAPVIP